MSGRGVRLHLLALVGYALLTLLILYPVVLKTGTHAAGYDWFSFHWNMWWIRHALTTPGLNVYESSYVFFPFTNNMAYHTLAEVWYPLWAVLEPLIGTLAAMTVILCVISTLNGYAMFALLRSEGVGPGLALVGGAALQALPITRYFLYNTHINLANWFWLPVHILLWKQIARAVDQGQYRRASGWALVQGIGLYGVGLSDLQFPIFLAFVMIPIGLVSLWRSRQRVPLALAGLLAVGLALGLLWVAGPLPYLARPEGTFAPGSVEGRPGIPFPGGYLSVAETWWLWNTPSTGAFITVATLAALALSLVRRGPPGRWLWFWIMLPPCVLSMGPTLTLGEAHIPMPFRLLHAATGGMFGMPWRLAPIAAIAALVFAGKTFTPAVAAQGRARPLIVAALLALLVWESRLLEGAPLELVPTRYAVYDAIGAERGQAGIPDYMVLEVPTAVGTGEVILGDPRAVQLQYFAIFHQRPTVNGFVARAPVEHFWWAYIDDPMMAWLGQRRLLEPERVEALLRERIAGWPIGYVVIHRNLIGPNTPAPQEIVGFLNALDEVLCPVGVEGEAAELIAYRARWHPAGCPPRTPPEIAPGVYEIDIGAPGDDAFLGLGWHWPERIFDRAVRWTGEYPEARLYVDLPPGEYRIMLTAQAFWAPRTLRVLVGGVALAGDAGPSAAVETGALQTFSFVLPAEVVGAGRHLEVTLAYDDRLIPAEVGQSPDSRPLAVMIDRIRFARQP